MTGDRGASLADAYAVTDQTVIGTTGEEHIMTNTLSTITGAVVATIAAGAVVAAGVVGSEATAASVAPLPTAPPRACPFDEAVGPVCVWDARHQGNGIGTSFVHYRGDGRHFAVSHRTAHALQNRDNWQAVPARLVGHRIDDLNGHGTIRIGRDAIVSFGGTTYVQVSANNRKPRHIGTS